MFSLPQLIEEDVQELDSVLGELIAKTEASVGLIIDIGGFLITKGGQADQFDTTTIGALASASFSATQAIASLVSEANFNCVYQQGDQYSLYMQNVDGQCLLVVIFKAHISVGAVKYYASSAIPRIAAQLQRAKERNPDGGYDLAAMNVVDTSTVFRRKS